ncbi:hypothetical protein P5V15_014155 [Pogonomyrmex californicus]
MEYIKLLLYGNIIMILLMTFSADENTDNTSKIVNINEIQSLSNSVKSIVPKDYNIELTLSLEENSFCGICNIDIIIYNTTRNIDLPLEKVIIIQFPAINMSNKRIIKAYGYSLFINSPNYVFYFDDFLLPGNYLLSMTYEGKISGGFIKIPYINAKGDDKLLIVTNNSTGMRRLFPCWDEPGTKARFNITIKHDTYYRAFSNIPLLDRFLSEENENITVTRFGTIFDIPTYRIAIALFDIKDYSYIISKKIYDFKLWVGRPIIQNETFSLELIENIAHIAENTWKLSKENQTIKEDYYVIADLQDNGMDKFQFVFDRNNNIIYDEEIDPIARKIEILRLIGRKVMDKLFGNVNPSWSHLWLHEGIATLSVIIMINEIMPDIHLLDLFVVQTQQASLHLDDGYIMNPLSSKINSLSPFTRYMKAPCILRMLYLVVGNEIFQEIIGLYLKKQLGGLDEFWNATQSIYSQTINEERLNISDVMEHWIKRKEYPVLQTSAISINVSDIFYTAESCKKWDIYVPSIYSMPLYHDDTTILPWYLMTMQRTYRSKIKLEDIWIIVNMQKTGYYRINYSKENWLKIALYLDSKDHRKINVLNRAQLIDDAFHFLTTGKLDSFIFWELINYLHKEVDYIAWYPMFKALERMSYIIPIPRDDEELDLKVKIQLLEKIGYKEYHSENHLTKCLRQEAAKWACILGDSKCKKAALDNLKWHLANQTSNKLLPWWKRWTYCNGLSHIPVDEISFNFQKIIETENLDILEALACSKIDYIVSQLILLRIRIRTNSFIKKHISLFYHTLQKHITPSFDNVLNNWDKIQPEEVSKAAALVMIINNIYTFRQLTQ